MTWGNPPKLISDPPKKGKKITPEQLAASGSEDGEQAALFCWSADNLIHYPQLKWLFAIPNGGSRHIVEAVKFVGTGTRAGVPDICLPCAMRSPIDHWIAWMGCYIELKIEKRRNQKNGGASFEQLEWIAYLNQAGYYAKVCYGWQEARDTLIAYLEGRL